MAEKIRQLKDKKNRSIKNYKLKRFKGRFHFILKFID